MRPQRIDAAVAAAGALIGVGGAIAEGAGPLAALPCAALGAAVGGYRSRPTQASILAVAALAVAVSSGRVTTTSTVLIFANAFPVGRWAGRWSSPLIGVAFLAAALAAANADHDAGFPPLLIVITAWGAGRAIRSHDIVAARLAERAAELEREREAYAALSVRYERARIASELHDIVAHAISVMVVQAGAGQRLAAVDPELTAETFATIGAAARQAEQDMAALVALLADEEQIGAAPDLDLIEELIARARGTGLDVTLRLEGSREGLPAVAVEAAYRVVRESLTNALRYASGAPVEVVVRGEPDALVVEVVNEPAPRADSLAADGTGNGLRGLHERVSACGGQLDAGPCSGGGWRVAARLPRRIAATVG